MSSRRDCKCLAGVRGGGGVDVCLSRGGVDGVEVCLSGGGCVCDGVDVCLSRGGGGCV